MAHSRFSQVIYTDDFFRSSVNGIPSSPLNRRFLRGLFDLTVLRLGLTSTEAFSLREGGTVDVERLMAELDLPASPRGWAAATIADLTPLQGRHGLPVFGPGCLVIGWGLPSSLQRCIDRAGASYLDIEVDAVRFTSHLHLCARSNHPAIVQALRACRIDQEEFWNEASAIKGYFARHGASSLLDPKLRVGIFLGQSLVDLSLISKGRLMEPADVVGPVRSLADSVDLLVIKPHPYEPQLRNLTPFVHAIPNIAWTHENVYALLCAENVDFVCGLSSGALKEAGYFLKKAEPLICPDRNAPAQLPPSCSEWMPVGLEVASMAFMATVCSGAKPTRPARWPSDALDKAFRLQWGFDAYSTGLRSLPTAEPGTAYTFDASSPAVAWLSHGWNAPEAWGVWTEGELACLVVPLPADIPDLEMQIRITGHCLTSVHPTDLDIYIDGQRMPKINGVEGDLSIDISYTRPQPGDEARGNPVLVIQFAIGNPQRPADLRMGTDSRRLGFALSGLHLSYSTDEPASTAKSSNLG